MPYALTTTQPSRLLHCSSRHVQFAEGQLNTSFTVQVSRAIEALPGNTMVVSLRSAQIPNTIYTIDERNNQLVVVIGASTYTYTLDSGNYDVNSLTEHLQELLGAATTDQNGANAVTWPDQSVDGTTHTNGVLYQAVPNKLQFARSSGAFSLDFSAANTCGKVLGFTSKVHAATQSGFHYLLQSDSIVDVSGFHALQLKSNIMQGALLSNRNSGETEMIASIPINAPRNAMILYPPSGAATPFQCFHEAPFVQGKFALADEDGVENINLQGLEWNFTLQFDFVKDLADGPEPPDARAEERQAIKSLPKPMQDHIRKQEEVEGARFLSMLAPPPMQITDSETLPSATELQAQTLNDREQQAILETLETSKRRRKGKRKVKSK